MAKTKKASRDYEFGRTFAEKCFSHSLTTGEPNSGGAESQMYCEAVALAIRDGKPITQRRVDAINEVKRNHNNLFYRGLCEFLLEKIREYQRGNRREAPVGGQ